MWMQLSNTRDHCRAIHPERTQLLPTPRNIELESGTPAEYLADFFGIAKPKVASIVLDADGDGSYLYTTYHLPEKCDVEEASKQRSRERCNTTTFRHQYGFFSSIPHVHKRVWSLEL